MEAIEKSRETKYEELIEKVIDWFKDHEEAFIVCIEELDSWNGYLGDDRYESMELLNEIYSDVEPMELLYRAFYGHDEDDWTETSWGEKKYAEFNPNRDFFRYNGYGNLVSTDYRDYSDHLDSYFVEELINNRNHVSWVINDYDELVELLDQIEAINDDIDEDEE